MRLSRANKYAVPAGYTRWRLAVTAAYLITWIFGVPAVQSDFTQSEIAAYKQLRDQPDSGVRDVHPRIHSGAAFPLLPGVIATYHSYSLANLYGWGGWSVHVWWGGGVRQIFTIPCWVS